MTPSHSNNHGRRYRYYVSRALKNNEETGSVSKIPTGEVEKFVIETTKEFLQDKKQIQKLFRNTKLVSKQIDLYSAKYTRLFRAKTYKSNYSQNCGFKKFD